MNSKKEKKSSDLTYLHKIVEQHVKDGKATTLEEIVVDGPKGLSIKYFSKSGDNLEKIIIYGKNDSFTMKSADGEKIFTKAELLDELKSNKKLKFAIDYTKTIKSVKSEQMGGAKKKVSKKSSKKSSKKVSKKSSKKVSKKVSKKSSKKVHKKI